MHPNPKQDDDLAATHMTRVPLVSDMHFLAWVFRAGAVSEPPIVQCSGAPGYSLHRELPERPVADVKV